MDQKIGNDNPENRSSLFFKGIIYSNIIAFVAFFIADRIMKWNGEVGSVLVFSEFVLVPIGMGIIAMKFWGRARLKMVSLIVPSLANLLIALILSAIFMGEGIVCLIIVSPLILAFMWIGIVIGKYLFRDQNTTLKTSTFMVFVLLFVFDTFSEHNYANVVSDEITIHAPKEKVWKYIAAYPVNTEKPEYWLFKVGLPNPIQSTVTGDSVGACRKCIFSNNAVFDEVIREYEKNKVFTFDITSQPADPEIIGHIEIRRGQFILKENPDGTTTLIGNSWYKLNVYPVWYYDWWAEDITRNVHIRVMKHIKNLAEKDV